MFYLFLILVFFYLVGDKKPKKENTFTQLERDLFLMLFQAKENYKRG